MKKPGNKIFMLMLALPLLACAQLPDSHSRWFRVVETSSSSLYPGVQGSPIVRRAEVKVVVKRRMQISADTAWFAGRKDRVEIMDSRHRPVSGSIKRGDTIIFVAVVQVPTFDESMPPSDRIPGSAEASMPGNYKGELMLRWYRKGKARYMGIDQLKKLEDVYAP